MTMKYQDSYETIHGAQKENDFLAEINDRETNTQRIRFETNTIAFSELFLKDGKICYNHPHDDPEDLEIMVLLDADDEEYNGIPREVWIDTIKFGTSMMISGREVDTKKVYNFPLSSIAKVSLHNRTGVSFTGDYRRKFSKLALAKLYEDFIGLEDSKAATAIVAYGKVQALMSSRYAPISQEDVFTWVKDKMQTDFQDVHFSRGYISHEKSVARWQYSTQNNIPVGIELQDSSTGYSGVIMTPYVRTNGHDMLFADTAWYSKHVSITEEDLAQGIEAIYLEAENVAKKLLGTRYVIINHPVEFASNVFEALNRLASRMRSAKMLKETKEGVLSEVSRLERSKTRVTFWDIISVFWEIPFRVESDQHQRNLQKTVGRILSLKYDKYDVANTDFNTVSA